MWAAEKGQEELDREKETEKKEKNKMKARKSTREQKNSLEESGAGGSQINAKKPMQRKISLGKHEIDMHTGGEDNWSVHRQTARRWE